MINDTGLIRRIDDLGRVVIPKEVRRTMKIREGDIFRICIDTISNDIVFRKINVTDNIINDLTKVYDKYINDIDLHSQSHEKAALQALDNLIILLVHNTSNKQEEEE